jgi:dienelactone hydrolase
MNATTDFRFGRIRIAASSGALLLLPGPGLSRVCARAQAAIAAASFVETSLTIGSGKWILPAVLTRPINTAPVPAIVLVHGSGPGDKDLGVGANKPFRDLADGLVSRGVAVLRMINVRGCMATRSRTFRTTPPSTWSSTIREAVQVLRAQPGIDPGRIFVLGLSLGGMLVPRIGLADPSLAGLIVMAGPARPVEDALEAQSQYLASADGIVTAEERTGLDNIAAAAAGFGGPGSRSSPLARPANPHRTRSVAVPETPGGPAPLTSAAHPPTGSSTLRR